MKVLISVFQVGLMVMVVLFSFGILEVVSYRTVNKDLVFTRFLKPNWPESKIMREVELMDLYHEKHWTIRFVSPWGP